jgi:ectoine hydroxylase-related dioxygenase (phytanoyl-CoA dioxygenase family)
MVEITEAQRRQFREEGYFILERAIPEEHLEMLRQELDGFIDEIDSGMEERGVDVEGLNHRGKRYFIALRHRERPRIGQFLFSELMQDVCRATLGDEAYLFWEQYVVKAADVGMTFDWHQDSGYLEKNLPGYKKPYLTCWCALDDVDETNGTIYVLPYSRAGGRDVRDHVRDEQKNDLVGYAGEDPGDPVVVPAGSVVVFSTDLLHRSGSNMTDRLRRAYIAQYSSERIVRPGGELVGFADPILPEPANA